MQTLSRDELQNQLRDNPETILVEVLDREAFDRFHLPNAINVPLNQSFEHNIQQAVPEKAMPVIVYCANEACDLSPRAAKMMDELGYSEVYDYEAGKEDWKQRGLPVEQIA